MRPSVVAEMTGVLFLLGKQSSLRRVNAAMLGASGPNNARLGFELQY